MNKKYDEDFFRTKFLVFMNFTYFQDLSNVNEQLVNEISINKIGYSNKNKLNKLTNADKEIILKEYSKINDLENRKKFLISRNMNLKNFIS